MSTPPFSCPPDRSAAPESRAPTVPVLHADAAWAVVDKPAGLPSVPGRPLALHDCAASRLQAMYPDALTVHRLDMATSGLLLFARGAAYQRQLSRAFAQREVDKRYVALVHGEPAEDQGEIDAALAADWPRRPRQMVDTAQGKPSLTRWRVLAREQGRTRLELQPLTGRTHQLRVHLAWIGLPIIGDTLYSPTDEPAQAASLPAPSRLMLHATRLQLAHPETGALCRFVSPTPF